MLRFAREAKHAVWVHRQITGQNLQRDSSIQSRVSCKVDLAHAAGAEERQHLIVTDRATDERRLRRSARFYGRDVDRRALEEQLGLPCVPQKRLHLLSKRFVVATGFIDEGSAF